MERRIELKTASELRTDTIPAVESAQAYRSLQRGKNGKTGVRSCLAALFVISDTILFREFTRNLSQKN
jgi:hypothetical protein